MSVIGQLVNKGEKRTHPGPGLRTGHVHFPVASNHRFAHASVLCISAADNLRPSLKRIRNFGGVDTHLDAITGFELTATPLLKVTIDEYVTPLNPQLGFSARRHPAHPFKELIKSHSCTNDSNRH